MDKAKEEKLTTIMLLFALCGLIILVPTLLISPVLSPELFFFLFGLGVGLISMASLMAFKVTRPQKSLGKNRRGALWIWAVCLLSIVVLAFAWFTLTWPAFILIDTIENRFTFPSEVQPAINLIKVVMGWFLILMALGLLLWAYVNSQRREDVTYPIG